MSDPYKRRSWRSHKFDNRTIAAIRALEDRLGRRVTIYQGSYSTSVGASGSTHAGGGAVDLWVPGMDADSVTRAARRIGWACWWRTPSQGDWSDHQHAILRGHVTASPDAKLQVGDFDNRGDGLWPLTGHDDPQPYRPVREVTFNYRAWVKQRTLLARIRHLGRDIAALKDRRRRTRRRLRKIRTT